jgi:hypothetical protein
MDFSDGNIKKQASCGMSFSVEKIGNPDFPAAFPENSENSGRSFLKF